MTLVAVYALPVVLMQLAQHRWRDLNVIFRCPAFVRGLTYVTMFYGIVMFGVHSEQAFVYFQF